MEKTKFINLLIKEHLKSHFIKPQFMCFGINGLKCLKLAILRFLPRPPPLSHTTLIAVKISFIVKTFIFYKFTYFYTYVLKCIFWGSNYFRVYGCWLAWLLLYVLMVADWLVQKLNLKKKNIFKNSTWKKQCFFKQNFHLK